MFEYPMDALTKWMNLRGLRMKAMPQDTLSPPYSTNVAQKTTEPMSYR
jgi:hypothetical protein